MEKHIYSYRYAGSMGTQGYWAIQCHNNVECQVKSESEAAFIVRACNAHEDLCEALLDLIIEFKEHLKADGRGTNLEALVSARAALDKAGMQL